MPKVRNFGFVSSGEFQKSGNKEPDAISQTKGIVLSKMQRKKLQNNFQAEVNPRHV